MSKAGSSKAFCLKIINWNSVTDHKKLNCLSLLQSFSFMHRSKRNMIRKASVIFYD